MDFIPDKTVDNKQHLSAVLNKKGLFYTKTGLFVRNFADICCILPPVSPVVRRIPLMYGCEFQQCPK